MDKVWKQLPYDLVEHIASLADIDTRRAMGLPPRKLVVPNLKLRSFEIATYHPNDFALVVYFNSWNHFSKCFYPDGKIVYYWFHASVNDSLFAIYDDQYIYYPTTDSKTFKKQPCLKINGDFDD